MRAPKSTPSTSPFESILLAWGRSGYRSRKFSKTAPYECCPRCDGVGEEPGAPEDADGVWLCDLCHGQGSVPCVVADAYRDEQEVDLD